MKNIKICVQFMADKFYLTTSFGYVTEVKFDSNHFQEDSII